MSEDRSETAHMFGRLMHERRSIRGFLPDPVPEALLRSVLECAQRAPSNCNVQPWVVHIVRGKAAEQMRKALHDRALSGAKPSPDVPKTKAYPGEYRRRQVDSAIALFSATGVARDDIAARTESFLRNFRFFDAPCAAFIFVPDWAGLREVADVGMYAQSLMLALSAHGLASCAQGALSHFADVVHEQLGIDKDQLLLFGISFGYPDPAHPANAAITDRSSIDDAIAFHG
jgi:nitroreductase